MDMEGLRKPLDSLMERVHAEYWLGDEWHRYALNADPLEPDVTLALYALANEWRKLQPCNDPNRTTSRKG